MDTTQSPPSPVAGTNPSLPAVGSQVTGAMGTPLFSGDQVDGNQVRAYYDTSKTPAEWTVSLRAQDHCVGGLLDLEAAPTWAATS